MRTLAAAALLLMFVPAVTAQPGSELPVGYGDDDRGMWVAVHSRYDPYDGWTGGEKIYLDPLGLICEIVTCDS